MEYSANQIIKIIDSYDTLIESMKELKGAELNLSRVEDMHSDFKDALLPSAERYVQTVKEAIKKKWDVYIKVIPSEIKTEIDKRFPIGQKELEGIINSK